MVRLRRAMTAWWRRNIVDDEPEWLSAYDREQFERRIGLGAGSKHHAGSEAAGAVGFPNAVPADRRNRATSAALPPALTRPRRRPRPAENAEAQQRADTGEHRVDTSGAAAPPETGRRQKGA